MELLGAPADVCQHRVDADAQLLGHLLQHRAGGEGSSTSRSQARAARRGGSGLSDSNDRTILRATTFDIGEIPSVSRGSRPAATRCGPCLESGYRLGVRGFESGHSRPYRLERLVKWAFVKFVSSLPLPVRNALRRLERDLPIAQRKRRTSTADMAERPFVSRDTLWRLECGDPRIARGTFVTAAYILQLLTWLAAFAAAGDDQLGLELDIDRLPRRIRRRMPGPTDGAAFSSNRPSGKECSKNDRIAASITCSLWMMWRGSARSIFTGVAARRLRVVARA